VGFGFDHCILFGDHLVITTRLCIWFQCLFNKK